MLIPIGFFGAGGVAGSYELIETSVLGADTATITFSSIPGTYKHLQVRYVARNNVASTGIGQSQMQFNSDSGANYTAHLLRGNGSSVTSSGGGGYVAPINIYAAGNSSTSGVFASGVVDILDYASISKNKTVRQLGGGLSGTTIIDLDSGAWLSTSAITSITFTWTGGYSYKTGSRFSLYGIKG